MKKTQIIAISALALTTALTSCNNFGATDTYRENQIGVAQTGSTGTIVSIKEVQIKTNNANAGTALGAVAGGLGGAMLGGGNAKFATAAGGAILGGLAGNQIEKAVDDQVGLRIGVKVDGQKNVTYIVQAKDKKNPLWVGQRVEVLTGGNSSRVIAL